MSNSLLHSYLESKEGCLKALKHFTITISDIEKHAKKKETNPQRNKQTKIPNPVFEKGLNMKWKPSLCYHICWWNASVLHAFVIFYLRTGYNEARQGPTKREKAA